MCQKWVDIEADIEVRHIHVNVYVCSTKIQDIKELQKQRNKQNGVNATALALGKKISKEQALSNVS